MNILAYEADTAWNRGILYIFFKTLIQYYLFWSFLYSLTYCNKEVIKGKIIWRLNEKGVGIWGIYGLKQGNSLHFFPNTDKKLYVLCSNLLTYCIIKGIQVKKFGDNFKKCPPLIHIFSDESWKKTVLKFSFDR